MLAGSKSYQTPNAYFKATQSDGLAAIISGSTTNQARRISTMSAISTISDFRSAMRNGPYAWPGGYPCYFVTADGAALSFEAAKAERRNILEALKDDDKASGWRVVAVDINWEDTSLYCAHTSEIATLKEASE